MDNIMWDRVFAILTILFGCTLIGQKTKSLEIGLGLWFIATTLLVNR